MNAAELYEPLSDCCWPAWSSGIRQECYTCSRYSSCAVPRVCETFSQGPCIRPPIVVRTNRIREDFGTAAIGLSKRQRYQPERRDATRLIPKPGRTPPRFSLAKVWWLKSGADTEICWMEGTSGWFLNPIPAATRGKRKHGSRVVGFRVRRYNSRTGAVVLALLYFQRLNENGPLYTKIKACRGLYGGKMLAVISFYFNYSNVLRYNWTTTQNIKLLILAGL